MELLDALQLHCKKRYKLPLAGNNEIIPGQVELKTV